MIFYLMPPNDLAKHRADYRSFKLGKPTTVNQNFILQFISPKLRNKILAALDVGHPKSGRNPHGVLALVSNFFFFQTGFCHKRKLSSWLLSQKEIVKLVFVAKEIVQRVFVTKGNCRTGFLSSQGIGNLVLNYC